MKKIVPFRKEIDFKTNISEITSISLEHTSNIKESVTGVFLISGDYKMADTSTNTEDFNYNIPFEIELDEKYLLDKATVDIDDFYYEIINDRLLVLNIEVAIDHLEEKPLPIFDIEDVREEVDVQDAQEQKIDLVEKENILEETKDEAIEELTPTERCVEEETTLPVIIEEKIEAVSTERKNPVNIFDNFDNNENYATYSICIIRDGDTIESIMEKYNSSKEELEEYNDLSDLRIGMKLIIPSKWKK